MYRFLAFVTITLLIPYASIGDAFAGAPPGHESRSKPRSAQSVSAYSISSRHHTRGADGAKGIYRSQLRHAKSDWRQAQRRGSYPVPVFPSASVRDG
jgi:hypothetical protein